MTERDHDAADDAAQERFIDAFERLEDAIMERTEHDHTDAHGEEITLERLCAKIQANRHAFDALLAVIYRTGRLTPAQLFDGLADVLEDNIRADFECGETDALSKAGGANG